MAAEMDLTDGELLVAARGFWAFVAGFERQFASMLATVPKFDETLSAQLAAGDRRYARRLQTLDRALKQDGERVGAALTRAGGRFNAALRERLLECLRRHADGCGRAFQAARKRHPDIKRPKGRPRRVVEGAGLGRALRLGQNLQRQRARRKYDRVQFVKDIDALLTADPALVVAAAIRQHAKAAGYSPSSKRVEYLRKRFQEWYIEVAATLNRA